MPLKPNQNYNFSFSTRSPAGTGATNADALPTATARLNGAVDAAFALTVSNLGTGKYRITGTVPASYAAGDTVQIEVTATLGGITESLTVDSFSVDTTRASDIFARLGAPTLASIAADIQTRSTHSANDVWAVTTRTLSAFGFTVNTNANSTETAIKTKTDALPASPAATSDIPTTANITSAVWGAATRTLSAFGFTVNTLANSTETAIKAKTDALPVSPAATSDIPTSTTIATAVWSTATRSLTGFGTLVSDIWSHAARSLSPADKEDIAVRVESHLLDEGDSQHLINALVGAIGTTNINQTALIAAIRSDIERSGGTLATILADYARRTGDYATPTHISAIGTQISALNNLSSAQVQSASAAALSAYDPPTRTEATADKNEILASIPTEIGGVPALPPAGSVLFNPRFVDNGNQGIPLALVEIYQSTDRIGTGTTNANGRVEFASGEGFILLKNVPYSVRVYAQGFQSHAPIALTLGADASPNYTLTALAPFPVSPDPQKAIVRVRTADFSGVPLQNETVTLTLDDQRPLAIGDKLLSTRFVKGQTNAQGEVDLEVWSDETLEAAGLKPIYDLKMTGVSHFPIRVPPQGGLASDLKATA